MGDPDIEKARQEFERDKKRFLEAKVEHEERIKPRLDKILLRQKKDGSSLLDDKSADVLEAVVYSSPLLHPILVKYVRSRVSAPRVRRAFNVHARQDYFEDAYRSWQGKHQLSAEDKQELLNIGGFYDRAKDVIHLRPTARLGDFLHEVMHRLASSEFRGLFGPALNEGVAQHFTNLVLEEQGALGHAHHRYQTQLTCARQLENILTRDTLACAYFQKGAAVAVAEKLRGKLGLTREEFAKHRADGKLLCADIARASR